MSSSPDRRVLRKGAVAVRPLVVATLDQLPHSVDGKPVSESVRAMEQAGWERGFRQGLEQGQNQAYREFAELLAPTLQALEAARAELARRDGLTLREIEQAVRDLAFGVAEAIVGRELELSERPAFDAVARALALAPERGDITARLNPDDVNIIGAVTDQLGVAREVTVVADSSVERGGCVVQVGACTIDAQIAPALARVREALR